MKGYNEDRWGGQKGGDAFDNWMEHAASRP